MFDTIWVIFVCDVREGSNFILLHVDSQFFQHHLNRIGKLIKNHLITHVRVHFWVLLFHFIHLSVVFMQILHCFDYYTFQFWNQEVWVLQLCSLSRLFWLFQIPWDSAWILGWVFLFLQKTSLEFWWRLHWICRLHGNNIDILIILFSNPLTWAVFLFISNLIFFQRCFMVFIVQLFYLPKVNSFLRLIPKY